MPIPRPLAPLSLLFLALLAFAQLASASFASKKAAQDKNGQEVTYAGQRIVPGAFLIEVGGGGLGKRAGGAADLTQVLTHLASPPTSGKPFSLPAFSTSRTLSARPSVFNGAVVKVTDSTVLDALQAGSESTVKQVLEGLAGVDGIQRAWPLRLIPRPGPVTRKDDGGGVSKGSALTASTLASTLAKRDGVSIPPASAYANDNFDPHVMTGVDKLHNQGVIGSDSIKVGIVDTGVDYLNPILGGCFGSGCHISFGSDLTTSPPGPTPYTNCTEHGTHVTGIVGALANSKGFSGVAPGVQLGHYRVFGCDESTTEDLVVAGILAAANDGVNIVTASIGGPAGWLGASPSQIAVERLTTQENIVATISAGNDREEGPFFAGSPASTVGGMSIGSVDVEQLPAYPASVIPFGNLPYLSAAPLDLTGIPAQKNGYRVYFTSTNSNVTNDACNPLPASTPDLSGMVTVVRRGTCTFVEKMTNVAAKGGKVALIYNSPNTNNMIPYLTTDSTGLAAVASLRYEEGVQLLSWYKSRPRGLYMTFPSDVAAVGVPDTIAGGLMSYFSNFGPTFELFGQPSLSGPGGNILSTFPLDMGGVGVISGTSMSCPFVAGASALLLSQRMADNLSPADVRALLSSTASKRETTINGTTFETVLLQGGGLVQVDKAISTRTIVSPFELMLNDTAFPAHTQKITLRNTNPFPMQYSVTTSSAQAYGTYDNGASTDILISTNPKPVYPQSGVAAFSTQRLRLQAGQSYSFEVTIPQPRYNAIDTARFPLYSGYIDISGISADRKHTEELHIPYFGVAAAMSDMPVLDSTATIYGDVAYPFIATPDNSIFDAPGSLSSSGGFDLYVRLAAGTRFISYDLILSSNAPNTTIPTERLTSSGGARMRRHLRRSDAHLPSIERSVRLDSRSLSSSESLASLSRRDMPSAFSDVPVVGNIGTMTLLPRDYLVDDSSSGYTETIITWVPQAAGFQTQANTQYRVLLRALKITADPSLESSYESWVSYPFTLTP
ncbi:Minor extracellular protease vpr [Rhodotorula toruloides]|nr:Minor extracellular protease vpr [Rhodotorula toruloides]